MPILLKTGYTITIDYKEMTQKYIKEIKDTWYSHDYSDYEPVSDSLPLFTPGSDNSDGYNEWALSEDSLKGKLIQYFFN